MTETPIEVTVRGVKAKILPSESFPGMAFIREVDSMRSLLGDGRWNIYRDDYWPSPADAQAFVDKLNAEWEREKQQTLLDRANAEDRCESVLACGGLVESPTTIPHGPFSVMDGAPWNVLDSRGVRIALCGGDSPVDWERHGPPIAAVVVAALNAAAPPASQPPQGEPQPREKSVVIDFDDWVRDRVANGRHPFTADQYSAAREAFYAAHPDKDGPRSELMHAVKVEPQPREFVECDTCRAKPGTPLLCSTCFHNRSAISVLTRQLAEAQQKVERLTNADKVWSEQSVKDMNIVIKQRDEIAELKQQLTTLQAENERLTAELETAKAAHGTASQLVSYASSELHRLLGYEPSAASLSTLFAKLEETLTSTQAALAAARERAEKAELRLKCEPSGVSDPFVLFCIKEYVLTGKCSSVKMSTAEFVPWLVAEMRRSESAESERNSEREGRIKAERSQGHTEQWYAERIRWLEEFFRGPGRGLPCESKFWNIVANGTPDHDTPPTYQQLLNKAKHRAEAAERELATVRQQLAEARQVVHGPSELGEGKWEIAKLEPEGPVNVVGCPKMNVLSGYIAIRLPDEKAKGDA